MTVPLGVPNLPVGALTIDNLAARLQDQTAGAIRSLANDRVPAIFNGSTGGSVLSDLSPFGIITGIWAEVISAVGNADPADIDGPEDLPALLIDFIEGLPVVAELSGLLQAISGTYGGADAVLLAVQKIFVPIRKLLQLVAGQDVGFPTADEVVAGWADLGEALAASGAELADLLDATGQATAADLGAVINAASADAAAAAADAAGIVDSLVQGFNGTVGTGFSGAELANIASGIAALVGWDPAGPGPANSLDGMVRTMSEFINAMSVSNPTYRSPDPSADVTYPLVESHAGAASTVVITQTASLIGYISTPKAGVKQSVSWIGMKAGSVTGLWVTLYAVDVDTGSLHQVYTSNNLIGDVGTVLSWETHNIPESSWIGASQGNWFAVELSIAGTGSYSVIGSMSSWSIAHPTKFPAAMAGTRGTSAPQFDAVGGPAATVAANSPNPLTWSHTIGAGANCIIMAINLSTTGTTLTAVTCGGQSMTQLGALNYVAGGYMYLYGLMNPPAGPQTVKVTYSGGTNYFTAASVSYANVGSMGAPVSASATSATVSQSVSSSAGKMLVNVIGNASGFAPGYLSYGKTLRAAKNWAAAANLTMWLGDSPGSADPVVFTAQQSQSVLWASYTVALSGLVQPAADTEAPATSMAVPWIALSGAAGNVAGAVPVLQMFTASGEYYFPSWANHVDIVIIGGGGGGQAGALAAIGTGGDNAAWATDTLDAADWAGYDHLTFTVGAGGASVASAGAPGGAGGNTTVQLGGITIMTAPGGTGGAGGGAGQPGQSPGNKIYSGPAWPGDPPTYYGGGPQTAHQGAGNAPGGGGGGGNRYPQSYWGGGYGAAGCVYIVAYRGT